MASTCCIFPKSIPLLSIVVTFSAMVTSHFSGCGIFSVLMTSLLLILSPYIFFIYSVQNKRKYTEGEVVFLSHLCEKKEDSSSLDQVCKSTVQQEISVDNDEQCLSNEKKVETDQPISQEKVHHQNELGRNDLYSESDTVDHSFSSDDLDNDDSISDEESLIEIAIPSGHYVSPKEAEQPKFTHLQQKFQSYSAETFLDQHGIIWEQFAKINDMNDEDNLIEIDLSMGSIKCSRFEIEG